MYVYLVEDDDAQREAITQMLERNGHTVEACASAFGISNRVAGRHLDANAPKVELVVLDLTLPGLSGAAALEILAKDPQTSSVPVVLYSLVDRKVLEQAATVHPRCYVAQKDGRSRRLLDALKAAANNVSPDAYARDQAAKPGPIGTPLPARYDLGPAPSSPPCAAEATPESPAAPHRPAELSAHDPKLT